MFSIFTSTPQYPTPPTLYTMHAFCCMHALHLSHLKDKLGYSKLPHKKQVLVDVAWVLQYVFKILIYIYKTLMLIFVYVRFVQDAHIMEGGRIHVI